MSGKYKSILIIVFLLPLLIMDVVRYFSLPDPDKSEQKIEIRIRPGQPLTAIADSLQKKGLIKDKKLFVFWAVSLGYEKKIKAGRFFVPFGLNYAQVAGLLAESEPRDLKVTLIEGWDSERISSALAAKLELDSLKLDSLYSDPRFLKSLGIHAKNIRGYLLPDTYSLPFGISEEKVVRFLVSKTLAVFKADTAQQALQRLGMTVHQALTLASIIQGEAVLDKERPVIASVYLNRLKRRMRLQADPTIQFLLKGKPRRLLYKDLKIESPYNTYLHYGLPPGPINNPGRASILAALFPAQTPYLYFVARGDGSHIFCRNAAEHARAKQAFNRLRRKVKRQKNLMHN